MSFEIKKASDFKGKKVLVFGLGILGGGVATTNWLLKHGAMVTVTDLKNRDQLAPSLKKIKGKVILKLGGHSEADIDAADIIVLNQDIALKNKYAQHAFRTGKLVETEGTIFLKLFSGRIIGITGTRGKTTTTAWTNMFLKTVYSSSTTGNTADENPFLEIVDRHNLDVAVAEIPSYQLEFFHLVDRAPEIAVITNIFQDHLNRHETMGNYAKTKAVIFKNQAAEQNLILNYDSKWTKFFLKQKPKSKILFFSLKPLPKKLNGVFVDGGRVFYRLGRAASAVFDIKDFVLTWGEHNLYNLLASSLAANLAGVSWEDIGGAIKKLPQIPFRQEIIWESKKIKIVNDTAATSPDGGEAAIKRFASPECVLIAGGTDRQLDFKGWTKTVLKYIKLDNLVLLSGSATDKMLKLFSSKAKKIKVCDSLEDCVKIALKKIGDYQKSVLLFSPAAKSFEKFKNEFNRGEQFNKLIKKYLKK